VFIALHYGCIAYLGSFLTHIIRVLLVACMISNFDHRQLFLINFLFTVTCGNTESFFYMTTFVIRHLQIW